MFQSTILQKFILSRLKDKLHLFFDLENSTMDGLTIRNLGIRPDLLQQLSQLIKVPLILTSGSIQAVSLNLPWEKLLSANKDQAIAVAISGISISAKLPNQMHKSYVLLRKKKIIEKFTQEFNKKATSRLTFINKLKQYFLGAFCVEVRNIELEISIQMKHSLTASLSVRYLKFQKDLKTGNTKLQVKDLVLGYRLAKDTKIENIINRADIMLAGQKTPEADYDNLQTNNLEISFNNENFNDVRKIITLIKWHNSFVHLPKQLWALKPAFIGETSPKKKLIYIANVIKCRISECNFKNMRKNLQQRKQYIQAFENFRKDPNDAYAKLKLNALDEQLQVWRVKEYRKFCLQWGKKYPGQPHSMMPARKEWAETKVGWLSYWFPRSAQSQLKQLQACLDNTPLRSTVKQLTFSIEAIKVSVSIKSMAGKEPFLNMVALNNQIETVKTPLGEQATNTVESEIQYNRKTKIIVNKLVVEYDQYGGHDRQHMYLLNQPHMNGGSARLDQDEFEDIEHFIECEITREQADVKILPFRIRINDDTLQKLSVFKMQRIHNTFQSAENILQEQNAFEPGREVEAKRTEKQLSVTTSVHITIPQNMCEKETQLLEAVFQGISFGSYQGKQKLDIAEVRVGGVLNVQQLQGLSDRGSELGTTEAAGRNYESVELMKTSLSMKKHISQSIEQMAWVISPVKIDLASMPHLKQLIRLISKLKPKQKDRKPLYRLKNLRRKQSIGEEFIDACQNLNEHLMRSATLSERTRQEKYILKQRRDKKTTIKVQQIRVIFQASELQLSASTVTMFEFSDRKSVSIAEQQKQVHIRIYDIKNCYRNIKDIEQELSRLLQLQQMRQQGSRNGDADPETGTTVELGRLSLSLEVYYNDRIKIGVEVGDIGVQIESGKKMSAKLSIGLVYYQYQTGRHMNNRGHETEEKATKQYAIEPVKVAYLHEKKYNKDIKWVKISSINMNIKPNLLLEVGTLFDKLNTPQKLRIEIINSTQNTISISTAGNCFKEYRPRQTAISANPNCDIILFNRKQVLDLSASSGTQVLKLTGKISLIKREKTEYIFEIQSNIRIRNRQQNTIWVRVITNRGMMELRKNSMREAGLVTFEHLSHAHMEVSGQSDMMSPTGAINSALKRSTSLNQKFMDQQQQQQRSYDKHEIDKQLIQLKKVNIVRGPENSKINRSRQSPGTISHNYQYMAQKDSDSVNESPRRSEDWQASSFFAPRAKQPTSTTSLVTGSNHQILFYPIGPEHTSQFVLNSQQYYLQIMEYNRKGEVQEKYQPFKVKQILKDNGQLLIHSYLFNSWGVGDDKQISSSLVIASSVCLEANPDNTHTQVYNIEVLSPIVMVNKIPQPLRFRFNKQEVDVLEVIKSGGRSFRKRSFQAMELETIQPFKVCRLNRMQYSDICETQIWVGDYWKIFRLGHLVEKLKLKDSSFDVDVNVGGSKPEKVRPTTAKFQQEEVDARIVDLLCLNNGKHEIQMAIQIRILKHVMKITVFPQFIFINLTEIPIKLQIQEQNYTYPQIQIKPVNGQRQNIGAHNRDRVHEKEYLKMPAQKLANIRILQKLFSQQGNSISIFTGSFDQDTARYVRYGDRDRFIISHIYDTYQLNANIRSREKEILYSNACKLTLRKLRIDEKPINVVLFMPSLYIINKSDWSFFVKRQGQKLKKIEKHTTEFLLINDTIAVQACEEYEEIAYNQWMKIVLTSLGTIYYAKQMSASNGYQSREYELRKKRLKKVPKLFFRIVMTKYQHGHQILIEESQYPPVSFISKCKSRIQIKQTTQNIIQEMENGEMAEYASKIPHHVPTFAVATVEHYQFKNYGEFSLSGSENQQEKVLQHRIKVTIEQYKDKKIIILEDYQKSNPHQITSIIRHELELEKLQKLIILVQNIQISILTKANKQLSCACMRMLEIQHETKNSKRYIKAALEQLEIFSYNGLQPKHLFYSKQKSPLGINKKEVIDMIKRTVNSSEQTQNITRSTGGNLTLNMSANLNRSSLQSPASLGSGSVLESPPYSSMPVPTTPPSCQQILSIDLVIDYHKHATILQKCKVKLLELVIVINANTLIDYAKYYYREFCELSQMLWKHELGRTIVREIGNIFGYGDGASAEASNQSGASQYQSNHRKNSINETLMMKKPSNRSNQSQHPQSPAKRRNSKMEQHHYHPNPLHQNSNASNNPSQVDFLNRNFIIENFTWEGLKVSIKFENLQNLQYFMNSKQIKYLLKFITWVGDLRPIEFSPTQVKYEQYTLLKLIQLIDVNKLLQSLYNTFLQYPLQQLCHIISFITKFIGYNDLENNHEQWHTFKRLVKSVVTIGKKVISTHGGGSVYMVNRQGELVEGRSYIDRFAEQNAGNQDIMHKITGFAYEEWRYKQEHRQGKLNIKTLRLERYSPPSVLLPYETIKSRIQTAVNDHCGNKLFREISHSLQINSTTLLALTQDYFVLYFANCDKQQWMVLRPEQVLGLYLESAKPAGKLGRAERRFTSSLSQDYHLVAVVCCQEYERVKGTDGAKTIDRYVFEEVKVSKADIGIVSEKIASMKLANLY